MKSVLDSIAEVAGYIWQKGWGERNGGNLTVNVTEYFVDKSTMTGERHPLGATFPHIANQYFYVKGTQKRMRDMARDPLANGSIIILSPEGDSFTYVTPPVAPTSELPSHLMVQNYLQQTGSRYKATLHTHPIELVALSHHRAFLEDAQRPNHLTKTLWSMIPETLAFAPLGIGIVPYQVPGSVELAKATLEKIKDYDVVLWEKHGVFAVGQDLMDAFDQVDVLNKAARIYLDALTYTAAHPDSEPEGMTDKAMQDVQRIFNLPKQRPC